MQRRVLTFRFFYLSLERLSEESSFRASSRAQRCTCPVATPGKGWKEALIGCEGRTEAALVFLLWFSLVGQFQISV